MGADSTPMCLWTIIGVTDVIRSFAWYQSLLGLPTTQPAHDYFGTIEAGGTVLLGLHRWGDHEHPSLTSPDRAEPGNGLLLFFAWMTLTRHCHGRVISFLRSRRNPMSVPDAGTREFALRDPDGYYVMVSALTAA